MAAQHLYVMPVTREKSNAYAGRGMQRRWSNAFIRGRQPLHQLSGQHIHILRGFHGRYQHGKFITAHACNDVRAAKHVLQPQSHCLQQGITHMVPQGVVHAFEAVQVQIQQGIVFAAAPGQSKMARHQLIKHASVVQPRQVITGCQCQCTLLFALQLGNQLLLVLVCLRQRIKQMLAPLQSTQQKQSGHNGQCRHHR